jgi:hypothetical protein
MANLELLNQTLPVSESPGIDTLDPKFQEIVALVENNDFAAVGTRAEALFQSNVFDIRVICYFFESVFVEQELAGVANIFACINKLVRENWAAVGPVSKKEKHTQRSLLWLLAKLHQGLQYHQAQNDDSWQKWLQQVDADAMEATLNLRKEFLQTVSTIGNDEQTVELTNKLGEWLNDFYKLVKLDKPIEPVAAEPEQTPVSENTPAAEGSSAPSEAKVAGSYHLTVLKKKLETFQILVQKGDFTKAAVVADDINAIMAAFDPRLYFPQLFSPYLSAMAVSLNQLLPCMQAKETPVWGVLVQLYQADIDAFVNLVLPPT